MNPTSGSRYLSLPIPPKTAILELSKTVEWAQRGILSPSAMTYYQMFKLG